MLAAHAAHGPQQRRELVGVRAAVRPGQLATPELGPQGLDVLLRPGRQDSEWDGVSIVGT